IRVGPYGPTSKSSSRMASGGIWQGNRAGKARPKLYRRTKRQRARQHKPVFLPNCLSVTPEPRIITRAGRLGVGTGDQAFPLFVFGELTENKRTRIMMRRP